MREHPCLPLWGRWHGEAVTEEVLPQYEFAESHRKNETLYRTSPAPYGGTLPKGEGFGSMINDNFIKIPLFNSSQILRDFFVFSSTVPLLRTFFGYCHLSYIHSLIFHPLQKVIFKWVKNYLFFIFCGKVPFFSTAFCFLAL